MILLKKSLPYFRTVHEITFNTWFITSSDCFDQILTDILHYFKPRILVISGFGPSEKEKYKNTKVQFRVPELIIETDEDMLESVLNKVIPTHSLRIIKDCKINVL